MLKTFNNILISVHPHANAESIIAKAVDFAGSHAQVHVVELEGNKLTQIERAANETEAGLIVMENHACRSWYRFTKKLSPSNVVKRTGVPVLMVNDSLAPNEMRTVVVPVYDSVSKPELEMVRSICKRSDSNIHLVTFIEESRQRTYDNASSLLSMFQWMRSSMKCKIDYAVLEKGNKGRAVLDYARKINADMMLVHAEKETRTGWWSKHIFDLIPGNSNMQVLAI